MRPLQVGLIVSLVFTGLAGILSNPLFTLASDSVTSTPLTQYAVNQQQQQQPKIELSSFTTVSEE